MGFVGALSSEWIKYRRTPTLLLVALVPPALAAASGWYARQASPGASWGDLTALAYQLWGMLCVPAGATLLAGLAALYEERADGWRGLFVRSASPAALYGAKLTVLSLHALLCSLLLVPALLVAGLVSGAGGGQLPWGVLLAASVLSWAASLPQLAFGLWLAVARGFGAAVAAGVPGVLTAMLVGGTSLGGGVWEAVPWAWPVGVLYPVFTSVFYGRPLALQDIVLDPVVPAVLGAALVLACLLAIGGCARFVRREW
jgi:lantibiotic protection ABC transporter MutG family permease subunit